MKAADLVSGDRAETHGDMRENFERIASLWSAYLGADISAIDVGQMMILLKMARAKSGTLHADHFIDQAGYAACTGQIATEG